MENSNSEITRVFVLYTGGTFGMKPDTSLPGNPLTPMELKELRASLPDEKLLAPGVAVTLKSFSRLIDSSSMNPDDWVNIANEIKENYDDHDGFIIIQGTDTLAYTASALSFMLDNLSKPVVVTGSQLPLTSPRTDANLNYGHALQIAGYKATDLPKIPEVIVTFADKILRGCRTRKMSASAWTGFESPNCPPLGEIGEHVRIFENQIRKAPPGELDLQVLTRLNQDVLDVSLYPGLRAENLSSILQLPNVKGVVLRTYGTGNAPEDEDFLSALSTGIQDNDKVVVNITQCPQGSVEMGLYAASVGLLDNGVISGLDMTPEAALAKLMVTMGSRVGDQVKLQMQINQRGEQSQNLFDLNFKSSIELKGEIYTDYIIPDRKFERTDLSTAVLRINGLDATNELETGGHIDVFLNNANATIEDAETENHARKIFRVPVHGSTKTSFVEVLSKEKVKNIVGDGEITLSFVPSKGTSFSFEKLSLSMFTRA